VRALLRRTSFDEDVLRYGDLELDLARHRVSLAANGFLTCGLGVVAIIVLPRDPSAANINEREEGLLADDRGKYRSTP